MAKMTKEEQEAFKKEWLNREQILKDNAIAETKLKSALEQLDAEKKVSNFDFKVMSQDFSNLSKSTLLVFALVFAGAYYFIKGTK